MKHEPLVYDKFYERIVSTARKNMNSRLLGNVNIDGQNHRFEKKFNKNGFISEFGQYFLDYG